MGNTRVAVTDDGTVKQTNSYYPFGMLQGGMMKQPGFIGDNDYLYNGKEFDSDIGLYDYGARFYDAQLARWHAVDPMAEKYLALSPYNYVAGNPLLFVDPNGEELYLYYYLSQNHHGGEEDKEADGLFWSAALTRAVDMLKSGEIGEGDKMVVKEISRTSNIRSQIRGDISSYKDEYGKTQEVGIWSHSGFDGPFRENVNKTVDQLPVEDWGGIDFNWVNEGGKLGFYGCRSGKNPNDRDGGKREGQRNNSFVEKLSTYGNMNNVEVWGQTQRSWPSPVTNARIRTENIENGTHKYPTYLVGSKKTKVVGALSYISVLKAYPMVIYKNGKLIGKKHQPGKTF